MPRTRPPGGLGVGQGASVLVSGSILAENVYDRRRSRAVARAAAPQPSNCDPLRRPIDGGGNLSDTDDCGFKNPPADPQLSADLDGSLGETPLLTIPPESPAVDLAGNCEGTDQRDLARPQGDALRRRRLRGRGPDPVSPPDIESGPTGTTSDTSPSFAFSSADAEAVFECRLDGPAGEGAWEPGCLSPRTYQSLAAGQYVFYVRADGGPPASRAFSVAVPAAQPRPAPPPAVPAQVPAPTPTATPQPIFRESVSVKPTKGTVKVKLPGTNRYVDLDSLDTIPFGASIDVRKGRVRLYAARNRRGGLQAASFYSGVFRVVQRGTLVELQLRGPKPRCASNARQRRRWRRTGTKKPTSKKRKARKRRLWGSGKGRFRTRGQYSAATVRGTKWLVEDSLPQHHHPRQARRRDRARLQAQADHHAAGRRPLRGPQALGRPRGPARPTQASRASAAEGAPAGRSRATGLAHPPHQPVMGFGTTRATRVWRGVSPAAAGGGRSHRHHAWCRARTPGAMVDGDQ